MWERERCLIVVVLLRRAVRESSLKCRGNANRPNQLIQKKKKKKGLMHSCMYNLRYHPTSNTITVKTTLEISLFTKIYSTNLRRLSRMGIKAWMSGVEKNLRHFIKKWVLVLLKYAHLAGASFMERSYFLLSLLLIALSFLFHVCQSREMGRIGPTVFLIQKFPHLSRSEIRRQGKRFKLYRTV